MFAFNYIPIMIDENEVGHFHLLKRHTEGIYPEMITKFWVSHGNVPGDTFIEAEFSKQTKGCGQAVLRSIRSSSTLLNLGGY